MMISEVSIEIHARESGKEKMKDSLMKKETKRERERDKNIYDSMDVYNVRKIILKLRVKSYYICFVAIKNDGF